MKPSDSNSRVESILEESAYRRGDRTAIIDTSGSYSYNEILSASHDVTCFLHSQGILPGSVVAFSTDAARCFIPILFGILRADCVALPIAPHLPSEEALSYADTADVTATLRVSPDTSGASSQLSLPGGARAHLLRQSPTKPNSVRVRFPGAAIIRFSSGTTAAPKGVLLSHTGVLERAEISERSLAIASDDRVLSTLSLSYHFIASAISFIRSGATILDGAGLSDEALVYFAQRHAPTMMYAAPSHYQNLCERAQPKVLASLRRAISASAPLPRDIARLFESRFHRRLTQVYGIIEVGLPIWNDDLSSGPEELGKPKEPYECQVVDEGGVPVAIGMCGELAVRGPGLFSGYIFTSGKTTSHRPDQWFLTGDLVTLDARGLIHFQGRKGSAFSIGDNTIHPEQIEAILKQAPEIVEARVCAEDHPIFGRRLIAEIVPARHTSTPEHSWYRLCEQELPEHLRPNEFRIVSAIPSTGSGKVLRHAHPHVS